MQAPTSFRAAADTGHIWVWQDTTNEDWVRWNVATRRIVLLHDNFREILSRHPDCAADVVCLHTVQFRVMFRSSIIIALVASASAFSTGFAPALRPSQVFSSLPQLLLCALCPPPSLPRNCVAPRGNSTHVTCLPSPDIGHLLLYYVYVAVAPR